MASYLTHSSPGRARVRDAIFADPGNRADAERILRQAPGVRDVRQGGQSLLILMDDDANLQEILKALVNAFPALEKREEEKPKSAAQKQRKCWVRALFAAGVTTIALAATGPYKWHAWAGGVFALLATHHVWERRRGIF